MSAFTDRELALMRELTLSIRCEAAREAAAEQIWQILLVHRAEPARYRKHEIVDLTKHRPAGVEVVHVPPWADERRCDIIG